MKLQSTLKHHYLKLVVAVAIFSSSIFLIVPRITFSQDISGIAGALIQGAINAQRMQQLQQQYNSRQQYNGDTRRRSSRESRDSNNNNNGKQREKNAEAGKQSKEAFEKIAPAAKDLIEDASTFVKENPSNPRLVEFIKKINELNGALAAQNAAKIKSLMEGLVADLRHEPNYTYLETARLIRKREEAEHYLPELIKTAKQQQVFIRYYITNNPVAPSTTAFIDLLKEIDSSLVAPDLDKMRALTSKIDVSIRQAGLLDAYVRSANVLAEPKSLVTEKTEPGPLRKTARNVFLIDGDPGDLVFLYNSSPMAPHVTVNLNGNIEFENNIAKGCLYQPKFAKSQIYLLRQDLLKYKLKNIEVDSSECSRSNLLAYDIVAVARGEFVKLAPEISIALYSEIESGRFKLLETMTSAQISDFAAEQASKRTRNEKYIEEGLETGYGVVYAGLQVDNICMVVRDKEKAHRKALLDNIEQLTFELGSKSPVPVVKASSGEAYKAFQRAECQAIYSSAPELKVIVAALRKNDTAYSVSSVWNTGEQIQNTDKIIQDADNKALRQEQDRLTALKTDRNLRDILSKERSETSKERQRALQEKNGKIASALTADIAKDARDVTNRGEDWQQSVTYLEFPRFSTWYRNLAENRWELQSFNSEIYDYGRAKFKGRALETSFVKVSIRLRNRILGEYKEQCLIFGRMKDDEFNMIREPVEVTCEQDKELSMWQKAHDYVSEWLVGAAGS